VALLILGNEGLSRPPRGLNTKSARRPPLEDGDGPRAPGSRADKLLPPCILATLIKAMRTTPRGAAGWRLCPAKLDRQPFSLSLCAAGSVRPLHSARTSTRTRVLSDTSSVDSSQVGSQAKARGAVYCMSRTMTIDSLDYPCLQPLSIPVCVLQLVDSSSLWGYEIARSGTMKEYIRHSFAMKL